MSRHSVEYRYDEDRNGVINRIGWSCLCGEDGGWYDPSDYNVNSDAMLHVERASRAAWDVVGVDYRNGVTTYADGTTVGAVLDPTTGRAYVVRTSTSWLPRWLRRLF